MVEGILLSYYNYDDFKPLDDEDVQCIIEEMEIFEKEEKYNKSNWTIKL